MAGACDSVMRLLSPYLDDELSAPDRAAVGDHLQGCRDCQGRLADLAATHAAMSAFLKTRAEAADFSGFTNRVMAQIRKEPLPFSQRARLWWSELMAYHSTAIYSGLGAATAAACAVLLVVGRPPVRLGEETIIHSMSVADPRYEPVVMHTEDGETITMLVEHQDDATDEAPTSGSGPSSAATPPHGGNL